MSPGIPTNTTQVEVPSAPESRVYSMKVSGKEKNDFSGEAQRVTCGNDDDVSESCHDWELLWGCVPVTIATT